MIARNLTARVELLSDVHIGTGTELMRDVDWIAPGDGYVYFADSDHLLEEVFARAEADGKEMREVAKLLAGSTLTSLYRDLHWLTNEDFGEQPSAVPLPAARQPGHRRHPGADQGCVRPAIPARLIAEGRAAHGAGGGRGRGGEAGPESAGVQPFLGRPAGGAATLRQRPQP